MSEHAQKVAAMLSGKANSEAKTTRADRIRLRMFAEQNGICALCGKPMILLKGNRHGFDFYRAATIDHIVPRSKGGRDTRDNMRLAHKLCNNKRGNSE